MVPSNGFSKTMKGSKASDPSSTGACCAGPVVSRLGDAIATISMRRLSGLRGPINERKEQAIELQQIRSDLAMRKTETNPVATAIEKKWAAVRLSTHARQRRLEVPASNSAAPAC